MAEALKADKIAMVVKFKGEMGKIWLQWNKIKGFSKLIPMYHCLVLERSRGYTTIDL
jgi:hypothetical protein